jgi:hypothetical protein
MNLSRVSHLPVAGFLAVLITVGMPALARLQPKPAEDPWLKVRPSLYPVAGTLVFEGKPVAGAVVTFVTEKEHEDRQLLAVSSTDRDGRFWLRTFSSHGDGAVAGLHRVKVEKLAPTGRMLQGAGMTSLLDIGSIPPWLDPERRPEPPGGPPMDPVMGSSAFPGTPEMVNILPARFTDETTSGLIAEVIPAEMNEFLIRLHADPPPEVDHGAEADLQSAGEAAF